MAALCRKGLLYYPDFCDVVLERFRESKEEEEDFYQYTFKVDKYLIFACNVYRSYPFFFIY